MFLGQTDVFEGLRQESDRRVGTYYLAKSRLSRIRQIAANFTGKLSADMLTNITTQVAALTEEAKALDKALGEISTEVAKESPDYLSLAKTPVIFGRMEKFEADVLLLEANVEGTAKAVGVPTEPANMVSAVVIGASLVFLASQLFRGKKK